MEGLGFVITAAMMAPVTHVAGAGVRALGDEPLFMEMRLPKLRIADSGMQIYADVCGLGFTPSKMSAGQILVPGNAELPDYENEGF